MAGKHYNYFEVLNQDTIRSISSPECASKDAKWIFKEEYIYACNSYTHSEFFFINNEGQNIPVSVSDAVVGNMSVRGSAEDYQLYFELIDNTGEAHVYRLHNDIRYNYLPFIGPKAFTPKYMEWDRANPVNELAYYLYELERLGLEVFDEKFTLEAKLRVATRSYNRLRRDSDIVSEAARAIDSIEIKEGIETLTPYAIEAFSSLKKLVLPSSLNELQEYSLYSYSLKEIYCKSSVPPVMKWFVFGENRAYPKLTIYVPEGTAEEYAKAWGFNGKPNKEFTFVEYQFGEN